MNHEQIAKNHILHAIDCRIQNKQNENVDHIQGQDKIDLINLMQAYRKQIGNLLNHYGTHIIRIGNKEKMTLHSCNEGNGPYFGRLTPKTCARCKELGQGAKTRDWIKPR